MHYKYIRTKTDILFHGLDEIPRTRCGLIEIEKWEKQSVKFVFYTLMKNGLLPMQLLKVHWLD